MNKITNDKEFKQALQGMDATQQRVMAALFTEHVLPLSNDERISYVVKSAKDINASQNELADALRTAKAATIDSCTRCGAEGNWTDQAGYFVARAAVAAVTPQEQIHPGSAWQAAMSSRMARTSIQIDSEPGDLPAESENEWQYGALSSYLKL